MRLHADRNHIDWKPEALHAAVTLNGERKKDVIYADEETGFIDMLATHNGQIVQRHSFAREPLLHRLFGEVHIIIGGANDGQG